MNLFWNIMQGILARLWVHFTAAGWAWSWMGGLEPEDCPPVFSHLKRRKIENGSQKACLKVDCNGQ